MSATLLRASVAALALACAAPAAAQTIASGRANYDERCATCHEEPRRSRVGAADLTEAVNYGFETFEGRVRNRPPDSIMPEYGDAIINDDEMCGLYLFIRSRRAGGVRDSRDVCFPPPPPAPPPPPPPPPEAPPAPSDATLEANRVLFRAPPPRLRTYVLDCWGGPASAVIMEPVSGGAGGRWYYALRFWLAQRDRAIQSGECTWISGPPPEYARWTHATRGSDRRGRVKLRWEPLDAAPIRDMQLRFEGQEARFSWRAGRADYDQFLNATTSERQRLRFIVSTASASVAGDVLTLDVHSIAIGRSISAR